MRERLPSPFTLTLTVPAQVNEVTSESFQVADGYGIHLQVRYDYHKKDFIDQITRWYKNDYIPETFE